MICAAPLAALFSVGSWETHQKSPPRSSNTKIITPLVISSSTWSPVAKDLTVCSLVVEDAIWDEMCQHSPNNPGPPPKTTPHEAYFYHEAYLFCSLPENTMKTLSAMGDGALWKEIDHAMRNQSTRHADEEALQREQQKYHWHEYWTKASVRFCGFIVEKSWMSSNTGGQGCCGPGDTTCPCVTAFRPSISSCPCETE